MKYRLSILCLVLCVPASLLANRFIVNTGPGPETLPRFSLGGLQWVAVEVVVPTTAAITRIDGWMIVFQEGLLDVSLYTDAGEVPGELLLRGPDRARRFADVLQQLGERVAHRERRAVPRDPSLNGWRT